MSARRRALGIVDAGHAGEGAACSLPPAALGVRRAEMRGVLALALRFTQSERGFVFSFPATDAAARAVCDAVLSERQCCGHFRYMISFTPNDATFELTVDAEDEYIRPLRALYASLLTEAQHD